ncbi:hypothetical protein [Bdellovibrio sp. HCB337]|uniref:hypothetical protein n=1 Tax=Bdellovibrio sp. HCB337 TaxID=3394358 RepID=UPI0039A462F7
MKPFLFLILIWGFSNQSLAGSAADCVGEAKNLLPSITDKQLAELCRGAKDNAPAKCVYDMKAKMPTASLEYSIGICKPVICSCESK